MGGLAASEMGGEFQRADRAGHGSLPVSPERRAHLERVLRDALLHVDDAAMVASEQTALQRVADRHAGEALTLDPVTVDLVAALLSAAFRVKIEQSPTCVAMSRVVAQSLWSDALVRERIEQLWKYLSEQRR